MSHGTARKICFRDASKVLREELHVVLGAGEGRFVERDPSELRLSPLTQQPQTHAQHT